MLRLFLIALVTLSAFAQQPKWYVFAHDDGCIDINILDGEGNLPHTPVSPQDYAQMIQAQGRAAVVEAVKGSPAALAGKVLQVTLSDEQAVVFIQEELCHNKQ